jgi:hypothetical protein
VTSRPMLSAGASPLRWPARVLLAVIGAELAIAVAILLHPPRALNAAEIDQDCASVREGLAVQAGALLDVQLRQGPGDPATASPVSPAVAAVRGTKMLWPKVPPSPRRSSLPAFTLVESTEFVPVPSSECTAFLLADPRPSGTAIVIRQFVRGALAEIDVKPGQRVVPVV